MLNFKLDFPIGESVNEKLIIGKANAYHAKKSEISTYQVNTMSGLKPVRVSDICTVLLSQTRITRK